MPDISGGIEIKLALDKHGKIIAVPCHERNEHVLHIVLGIVEDGRLEQIGIEPLEAYARDSSYNLNVSKDVRSVGGQTLKSAVKLQFKV